MSYVLPQVQVFQEFSALPTEVVANQNAFIFGPHYELLRYNQSDEKPLTSLGAYDRTQDTSYGYPNKPVGSTVDLSYAKLYGEDIWLNYFTINGSALNPFVMVSAAERNKLRAAPRIVDGGFAGGFNPQAVGGYHTGMIDLPEAYYLVPQAKFNYGTEAGVLDYITTEGVTGEVDIPANAISANVITEGPDGIAFDFDGPAADVKKPLTVTIKDAGGTNYFTVAVKPSALSAHAEAAVAAAPIQVSVVNADAGTFPSTWVSPLLTIKLDGVDDTLDEIRADILALGTDVTSIFDISDVVGVGTTVPTDVEDQDAVDLYGTGAVDTVPDVIKVLVYENNYVFQTANGVNRTATLFKDIKVGDKIVYTVTPSNGSGEITVETTVAGLEEDYLRPIANDPVANVNNDATQVGTDISVGTESLVAEGPDNQVPGDFDLDGGGTTVHSLAAVGDYRQNRLTLGVLSESYTLTVTKQGVAGTAEMSVEAQSGAYSKYGVLVEEVGGDAGQIYIGDGVYVNFVAGVGNPSGTFKLGDQYIVGPIDSQFTKVAEPVMTGSYGGTVNTVYTVTVTRGGVFDRTVITEEGLVNSVNGQDAVLTASLAGWTGGDVDDEYILECTQAGSITLAKFKLTSLRGDNETQITFTGYGAGNAIEVGASGLELYLTDGAPTDFAVGEYFIILVKAARPKVQITDSAGNDQEGSVIVNDGVPFALGLNGLILEFPANVNGGLSYGDRWTVTATATSKSAVQTIILEDDITSDVVGGRDADGNISIAPDLFVADVMLVVNSQLIPQEQRDPAFAPGLYNWEGDATQVTINSGITMQNSQIVNGLGEQPYLEVYKMDMYFEYRALLSAYAGAIASMDSLSEVTALGKESPDNPLRLGVQAALENAGDSTVYFAAVASDDDQGYLSVLDKASVTDKVYSFVPLTEDQGIHDLVQAHVNAMSTETNKRWRRMFVGTEQPSETGVVTKLVDLGGLDFKARVIDDPQTGGIQYTLVEFDPAGTNPQLLTRVNVGDQVRMQFTTDAWGNETYVTDTVADVRSSTQLVLVTGLDNEILDYQRTEVWHTLTTEEVADAVAAITTGYGDQRVCHVFPGRLGRGGEYVSAMYGAASIAGLISSVPPQQGLTNLELVGYDDIPLTYGVFSQSQLNKMAEEGTMIIMQETQGGEIFIRHQLTTAAGDGDLRTAELSIVKNLDSISYYMAGRLKPFIGRYNVTPDLIEVIETSIQDGLDFLGSQTDVGLLGPQVLLDNTSIRTVEQHPTLKDRILAIVDLDLPAPLNVIELYLVV